MAQDLSTNLICSKMDRAIHMASISVSAPLWHSACNPLAHGRKHDLWRTPQFDESSISLVPRIIFRCVFPGLWRCRWPDADTAPSPQRDHPRRTAFGFPLARHATNIYGYRQQFDEHSCDLECERISGWQWDGRNDQR
jgi:hypothetical protein